jgi:hypothetical protein
MDPQDSNVDAQVDACPELHDGQVPESDGDCGIFDGPNDGWLDMQSADSDLEDLVEDDGKDSLRCVLRTVLTTS